MTDADLVLFNGSLWTGDRERPTAQALAVKDGRITAVGTDDEIRTWTGRQTQAIDLRGRMVTPGFQDAHCHPPMGGIDRLNCDLSPYKTKEAILAAISRYASENPDREWITGGGWGIYCWGENWPTAAELDAVTGGRPAYLLETSGHDAWANSEALRRCGIDEHTPDPAGGYLARDADGKPTGMVHESAMALVSAKTPPVTPQKWRDAILVAQDYFLSCGVTAWQDAAVGDPQWGDSLEVYRQLEVDGLLHIRTVGALWWWANRGEEQIPDLVAMRERSIGKFQATTVKIMVDGAIENGTAPLTETYCKCFRTSHGSGFLVEPEPLKRYVTQLDALGFQVHFHAVGDLGIRAALDALEVARNTNGSNDNRHHIAHVQLVHPVDIPRFGELDVVANCQPLWACHAAEGEFDAALDALGEERFRRQYPFNSLSRTGARLAFGSDWNVSGAEVPAQLDVAVTRTNPADPSGPVLAADERLTLHESLTAFTSGSAYVNHLDATTGTLSPGKFADLCILDRDITADGAGRIADAQVDATIIGGVVRYQRGTDV